MRKTTLALGVGLALSLGASDLTAQQQRPDHPGAARAGNADFARGQRGPGMLLRGITLTEAQKAQLKAHREQQQEARRASRDSGRAAFEAARAARQRGDTAALREMRVQRQAGMTQQREAEIAAIRAMLTPEQRTQFDSNVAEMKPRAERRAAGAGEARGPRGPRGARGARGGMGAPEGAHRGRSHGTNGAG